MPGKTTASSRGTNRNRVFIEAEGKHKVEVVNDRAHRIKSRQMEPLEGACEAWKLLLRVVAAERARLPAIAAELGLSEAQCQVLQHLDPAAPVPMCRLAETLDCDRSNVTGIVGRLEARGLVDRRPSASDRRVKNLVLTDAGRRQRQRLLDRLGEPPAGIRALPREEQNLLQAILRRAFASGSEP
jgi:DNA-binding MarR family transcriptional regulator